MHDELTTKSNQLVEVLKLIDFKTIRWLELGEKSE